VLRVGVDGGRHRELFLQQLAHQRNPRAPSDQDDGIQVGRLQPGRPDRPPDGGNSAFERRPDELLQFAAGQPDGTVPPRQPDRDHGLHVVGERLLGFDTVPA
jgi:hypothetical protein